MDIHSRWCHVWTKNKASSLPANHSYTKKRHKNNRKKFNPTSDTCFLSVAVPNFVLSESKSALSLVWPKFSLELGTLLLLLVTKLPVASLWHFLVMISITDLLFRLLMHSMAALLLLTATLPRSRSHASTTMVSQMRLEIALHPKFANFSGDD